MNHADLLGLLLPHPAYTPSEPILAADLGAEGAALDRALADSGKVQDAITPYFAGSLLADWERLLAIVPSVSASYQQRMEAVLAKLGETGGLSIPYFIRLASRLGYVITITEPQPFRAGTSRAGEALWTEDIIWVWRVDVRSNRTQVYYFRAGRSTAGEALTSFGDPVIEQIFNDLKPAHTFVYFTYKA
mgnify:CR=1 FL=1